MKILLVSPLPPPVGGIATVTSNLITYLERNPQWINLILCNTTHRFRSITSQSFFIRIFTGFYNSLNITYKIRRTIKNESPDLIHLASSSSFALLKDLLIIFIARYYETPILIHWHFGRIPTLAIQDNWEWKLLKFVIRKSSHSIVIDSKSFLTLKESGLYNVNYIANPLGLDVEQKMNENAGKKQNRIHGRLVYVGHIVKSKGIYELIKACIAVPKLTELHLIGPCEDNVKKELKSLAEKRNKGRWLKFSGELNKEQVLQYLSESPILTLPSHTEGFPNAVLEGMAMGCAVIATDVGAIPEMLDVQSDKPCGICVPPRNIELLARAINELISEPSITEAMGRNGIERVLVNYTIQKIAGEYIQLWQSVIDNFQVPDSNNKAKVFNQVVTATTHTKVTENAEKEIIRVLLVSPLPPPVGGIASWTPNILKYFRNEDLKIKLSLLNSALKGKSITSDSLIRRYASGIYNFLWINWEFRKFISSRRPDLIHLISSSSLALFKDYFLIRRARILGIPVVMHWRFGRIPAIAALNNWEWKLLKQVIKISRLSIVIDSRSYDTLCKAGFKNVYNIPNPLRLTIEEKSKSLDIHSNLRMPGHLIFVGHIVRSKGVYELVEACSELTKVNQLSLIGPCEIDVIKELRELASAREDGTWLKFIGELNSDQVIEYIHNTPILVLPSYTEGFPNAVLEGMAMGCAIIATDVGAIPEMLNNHGKNPCGICVPARNVEKLKEAIHDLLEQPALIKEMGINGTQRVLNNYTMEEIARQYIAIWEEVSHK